MCNIFHIQYEFRNPEIWRMLFLSFSFFGMYLAAIILFSVRIKRQHSVFLGFFLTVLAILLFHMTMQIHPLEQYEVLSYSLGMTSLFLIGPFSFHVHIRKVQKLKNPWLVIQLIPAMVAGLLSWLTSVNTTWILLAGIVHIGMYLLVRQCLHTRIHEAWNKRLILVQGALYTTVLTAVILCSAPLSYYIAAICLMVLILLIWIRLLRTSIAKYIN